MPDDKIGSALMATKHVDVLPSKRLLPKGGFRRGEVTIIVASAEEPKSNLTATQAAKAVGGGFKFQNPIPEGRFAEDFARIFGDGK